MISEVYNGNSPLAEELIAAWNEKNDEVEKLTREMNKVALKMKTEFSRFKFGDVIRNTKNGKKYIVAAVQVREHELKSGCCFKPSIEFNYEVKPIRKDGMPSANFSHEYFNCGSEFEPTGECFNFQTHQYK